ARGVAPAEKACRSGTKLAVEQSVNVGGIPDVIVGRWRHVIATITPARVRRDDTGLARLRVIDVEHGQQVDRPLDWFESGLALKQVHRQREIVLHQQLLALAEKLGCTW